MNEHNTAIEVSLVIGGKKLSESIENRVQVSLAMGDKN